MSTSKLLMVRTCWNEKYSLPFCCHASLLFQGPSDGQCLSEMGHSGVREEGFVKENSVLTAEGEKPNPFFP